MKKRIGESEFLFILGDNYGHNYFRDNGPEQLVETNEIFYKMIKENFPDKIIIPVIGNHESHPLNYFDFDDP